MSEDAAANGDAGARVAALFAGDGPLAHGIPGFTPRDAQVAMAVDVAALVRDGGALACEAGTGTGKTLAYLMPLMAERRRALLSTGTRNLQDQLFFRDLPLARDATGFRGSAALLKGRGNYLCRQRLDSFTAQGRFVDRQVAADMQRIRAWAAATTSGDVAELEGVPEHAPAWRFATSTRDNCLGTACRHFEGCHLFEARRRAAQADLVVVNHHLLLSQLALAEEAGDLLPRAPVLVVDEAHQLPDLATEFFGETVSSGQLTELARDVDVARRTEAVDMQDLSVLAEAVERRARDLHLSLDHRRRRVTRQELASREAFQASLEALGEALEGLDRGLVTAAERGAALAACRQRAGDLVHRLALLRDDEDPAQLSWLERRERSFTWRLSPLDTGPLLGPGLESRHTSLLFTSATLAVAGGLSHFTGRLGVTGCDERVYASPFDYRRQALLYLPPDMPEPRDPDFAHAVHACVREVLGASRGRAFVLFTSHAALAAARDRLAPELRYPVLVQGQAPRGQLLERFRDAGNAVLLGTYSFWEGVDVRGEALSCVIIDKLPFAPPDDPLLRARHAALREAGRDPFNEQQLPQAALALKQGVGRLIRDAGDRGVVVICDPRLRGRGYGRRLLASLPDMTRTRDLARVRDFFSHGGGDYTAPPCAPAASGEAAPTPGSGPSRAPENP